MFDNKDVQTYLTTRSIEDRNRLVQQALQFIDNKVNYFYRKNSHLYLDYDDLRSYAIEQIILLIQSFDINKIDPKYLPDKLGWVFFSYLNTLLSNRFIDYLRSKGFGGYSNKTSLREIIIFKENFFSQRGYFPSILELSEKFSLEEIEHYLDYLKHFTLITFSKDVERIKTTPAKNQSFNLDHVVEVNKILIDYSIIARTVICEHFIDNVSAAKLSQKYNTPYSKILKLISSFKKQALHELQ